MPTTTPSDTDEVNRADLGDTAANSGTEACKVSALAYEKPLQYLKGNDLKTVAAVRQYYGKQLVAIFASRLTMSLLIRMLDFAEETDLEDLTPRMGKNHVRFLLREYVKLQDYTNELEDYIHELKLETEVKKGGNP
ncbi:MAG: hypothetical protein LQ350_007872 [Teloschistes chrysophthalmus]|nr:MAG: hypothetical protein LQ350_007872 [Niorma chrysophthalma]